MSDKLRRSERNKSQAKQAVNEDKTQKTTSLKDNTLDNPVDDQRSINSHISRNFSMNTAIRQKLAIQLEYAKKKKQHEQEMKQHEQEILDLEMALKLAEINEEHSIIADIPDIPVNNITEKSKVETWFDRQEERRQEQDIQISESTTNINLSKLLSRQSLPKELPIFSGNPTEWPNFICQFRNSTEICGFTNEENQYRLQKCLKGKAREIVNSLLILPKNVNKVISTLERRFGRPEYIISILLEQDKRISGIKEEKLDLIEFSDTVSNLIFTLQLLNENDHLRNPLLLQELINKLPNNYKMRWLKQSTYLQPNDLKLEKFQEWLADQADMACQLQVPYLLNFEDKYNSSKSKPKNVFVTTGNEKTSSCYCCSLKKHPLNKCQKFLSFIIDERWTFVTSKRICFSCLTPGHGVVNCLKKELCGINGCKRLHHKLLHNENKIMLNGKSQPESKIITKETNCQTNCHMSQLSNDVLLKILPVKLSGKNRTIDIFALLDDASTVTLIDEEVTRQLHLDGPEKPLHIQWTNEEIQQNSTSKVVNLTICGEKSKSFFIRHARTIKGLSLPTQIIDMKDLLEKYSHLDVPQISKSKFIGKPTIFIGQDNWPLLIN